MVPIIKESGISRYHFPNSFPFTFYFSRVGGDCWDSRGEEKPFGAGVLLTTTHLSYNYRKLRILRYNNVQILTFYQTPNLPIYLRTPMMNKGFSERVD